MTSPKRSRARGRHLVAWCLLLLAFSSCSNTKTDPKKDAAKLLDKGLAAQVRGDVHTASSSYSDVLKIDPQNKWAYYNLGLIDQQSNRSQQAEANYRKALVIDPKFPPALFNLAIIRTGPAPQEAADLYRQVIAAKPNDAAAHLNLGYLLRSQKDEAGATAEIDKALALNPKLAATTPKQPGP